MKKAISLILCGALFLAFAGCSDTGTSQSLQASETSAEVTAATSDTPADNSDDKYVSAYSAFKVTSESLEDGKWVETCANIAEGGNASPQLSWEPVEGATVYVIYMVDMNTNNFLHWKSDGVTETTLPQGWASSADYIGPYPPSGSTHQYNIYVFALRAPVERAKGSINSQALKLQEFMEGLDTDKDGNTGNIIAVGKICGNYTAK